MPASVLPRKQVAEMRVAAEHLFFKILRSISAEFKEHYAERSLADEHSVAQKITPGMFK